MPARSVHSFRPGPIGAAFDEGLKVTSDVTARPKTHCESTRTGVFGWPLARPHSACGRPASVLHSKLCLEPTPTTDKGSPIRNQLRPAENLARFVGLGRRYQMQDGRRPGTLYSSSYRYHDLEVDCGYPRVGNSIHECAQCRFNSSRIGENLRQLARELKIAEPAVELPKKLN